MNRKRLPLFLTILMLSCAGTWAQTLTLEQMRTLALANSRSLAKYNLAVNTTLLTERSRIYSNFPSISLGANASMNLWNSEGSPTEKPFDTFSSGLSVSISQNIFEGGKTLVQKAINQLATESARNDALAEYFNVLDQADSAYYAVLEAAAALEAEERSLQTATLSLSIAEVRQSSGIINQGDYLKVLSEKESREASFNQARRNLVLNVTKLKSIAGLKETPDFEQIDFDEYEALILYLGGISDSDADTLYDEMWKLLAAQNPALAKAGIASLRAEKNLSLIKRDYVPSINASLSLGGFTYSQTGGFEASSNGKLSITGSIPLDFWVKANNVQKSKIERDTALMNLTDAEIDLETRLQEALLNLIAQAGQVLSSRRALDYAEKHFEYIMERFRLAQSSPSELSDASVLASSSRNQLIKARYAFLRGLSALRSLGAVEDEAKLMEILRGVR